MAASSVPLLWWILFILRFFFTSADQKNITAEPGQNVILSSRAAGNKPVIAVEWRRSDLGSKYVLLYKDDQLDPFDQHPSYKNRVDLQDRQMKDGDVSLVLQNVTTTDTGTYECEIQSEGNLDTTLISIIQLKVSIPGDKHGGSEEAGNQNGSTGLTVGLILFLVLALVAAGVLFLIYKKQSACFKKKTSDPPADL